MFDHGSKKGIHNNIDIIAAKIHIVKYDQTVFVVCFSFYDLAETVDGYRNTGIDIQINGCIRNPVYMKPSKDEDRKARCGKTCPSDKTVMAFPFGLCSFQEPGITVSSVNRCIPEFLCMV